ncbi:MarR family winged helix-turn-helix transcriptional regulator [Clostridium sp. MB05]|uniref:MarR family winged helix-turn-helix transcriptional regulator n=1 Tax=Clostridium sp. MB05 TaxID=3376682 RepID=UPI0039824FC9
MQGFFQRFISLYRPIISKLNDLLSEYNLSYSLWQVIFYLKNNGPSSLVDISKYYNIEKPSVTRRVQSLEEKMIIEEITGKNKREKIIQLTETGEELYQICREKITCLEYELMKGITKEEQQIVFEVIPRVLENITNEKEN